MYIAKTQNRIYQDIFIQSNKEGVKPKNLAKYWKDERVQLLPLSCYFKESLNFALFMNYCTEVVKNILGVIRLYL